MLCRPNALKNYIGEECLSGMCKSAYELVSWFVMHWKQEGNYVNCMLYVVVRTAYHRMYSLPTPESQPQKGRVDYGLDAKLLPTRL